MKKTLLLCFILTKSAAAAELSCSSFYATNLIGLDHNESSIKIGDIPKQLPNNALYSTNHLKFQIYFLDQSQIGALAGNHILFKSVTNTLGNTKTWITYGGEISNSTPLYNEYEFTCTSCVPSVSNHSVHISGSSTELTAPLINEVPTPHDSIGSATNFVLTSNYDGTVINGSSKFGMEATMKATDNIFIPDEILLGTLNTGNNSSDIPLEYRLNTNNVPIYFKEISASPNSKMSVEGKSLQEHMPYNPPIRVGLSLLETAQPGTYTSIINATWTCP
ncbi:hypothetical protein [Enterobacter vonholyi]|uniref:hypothetical protein n=1 Tax=Enterobacter vonholyi TaxID=2797505 RepID=UPI00266622D7|nr:hypothetical protein [Enterobacter vonholyi]MDO2449592.1 hypothetical protein [Enterobacter vonholyi]